MLHKTRVVSLASLLIASFMLLAVQVIGESPPSGNAAPQPRRFEYPAPRYPKVPNITTVEQLLPYARRIVGRPMPYTGDQRPGFGIKGGEKVLFITDSDVDPLVVEAFLRVLRDEKKCKVDVFQQQGSRGIYRTGDLMKIIVDSKPGALSFCLDSFHCDFDWTK